MMDGIAIIDRVLARGAQVKVLDKPHLISPAPSARASSRSYRPSPRTSGADRKRAGEARCRQGTGVGGDASRSSTSTSRPRRDTPCRRRASGRLLEAIGAATRRLAGSPARDVGRLDVPSPPPLASVSGMRWPRESH
jgi:hypothetical protein